MNTSYISNKKLINILLNAKNYQRICLSSHRKLLLLLLVKINTKYNYYLFRQMDQVSMFNIATFKF